MNIGLYPRKDQDISKTLNLEMLEKKFNVSITTDLRGIDILICLDVYPETFPINKTILLQKESPLTEHRIWTYKNFDKFHTVITNSPMGKNQFKFTEHPEVYPWNPFPGHDRIRKSTKIKNRIVFFAGQNSDHYASVPDQFPNISTLYDVRAKLVKDLNKHSNFKIYGRGWPKEVRALSGVSTKYFHIKKGCSYWWDFYEKPNINKFIDIDNSGADFVLVLENTMQPNLIAEKIHDGFMSDRVVLYFGEQQIETHVPINCFVDLRPFFNKKNKKIDADKLMDAVNNMSQKKYDEYINYARQWRKTLFGKWEKERDKLTKFLIERIKSKDLEESKELRKNDSVKTEIENLKNRLNALKKT